MVAATHRVSSLVYGLFHFVVGALLLAGGGALLVPLSASGHDFLVLETIALIAALAVDQLVGPELRRLQSGR